MEKKYLPEGFLFSEDDIEKQFNLQSLTAFAQSGDILEARVTLCDTEHNLHVRLGTYEGIVPRDEVAYSPCGERTKDIAIITRVGKVISFIITGIYEEGGQAKFLLSRRLAQKECYENYISFLKCGDVIDATVTHTEPFGAFCDIGCGMVSLLPIDCISVSRIMSPSERLYTGKSIRAIVKDIDGVMGRVTLSHKELLGTWQENADLFSAGQTVSGIIRSIEPYGVFVELSPNLAGLAEYCDNCYVGQAAAVYIKSIIPEKMKVKLVIVDLGEADVRFPDFRYFFKGEHIDKWVYSPESCPKRIEEYF